MKASINTLATLAVATTAWASDIIRRRTEWVGLSIKWTGITGSDGTNGKFVVWTSLDGEDWSKYQTITITGNGNNSANVVNASWQLPRFFFVKITYDPTGDATPITAGTFSVKGGS